MTDNRKLGRRLNTRTMMWEFSDGSGVAVPDELMPRPGDMLIDWLYTRGRLERAAIAAKESSGGSG